MRHYKCGKKVYTSEETSVILIQHKDSISDGIRRGFIKQNEDMHKYYPLFEEITEEEYFKHKMLEELKN